MENKRFIQIDSFMAEEKEIVYTFKESDIAVRSRFEDDEIVVERKYIRPLDPSKAIRFVSEVHRLRYGEENKTKKEQAFCIFSIVILLLVSIVSIFDLELLARIVIPVISVYITDIIVWKGAGRTYVFTYISLLLTSRKTAKMQSAAIMGMKAYNKLQRAPSIKEIEIYSRFDDQESEIEQTVLIEFIMVLQLIFLENTIAYIIFSLMIIIFWWFIPKNIHLSAPLLRKPTKKELEVVQKALQEAEKC